MCSVAKHLVLVVHSIYLFSNTSIFDYEEDPDYIVINFLYKNESILREYLYEEYNYELENRDFKPYYFDNYDFYFINNFIKENNLINKYKDIYNAKNKKDFLSKIKNIADTEYSYNISELKDRKELKGDFNLFLNNDGFISEYEFYILNEKLNTLPSNDEEVYNFCTYSTVLLDLKNQCYKEYQEKCFVSVKTENIVNEALYDNDLYLEFIDYSIYLDSIREDIDDLNESNLSKLLENFMKDDFFSNSDYETMKEEIRKVEREQFLDSESDHYQNLAANFVIENNGKTKNDILKMKEEYGYLPKMSKKASPNSGGDELR